LKNIVFWLKNPKGLAFGFTEKMYNTPATQAMTMVPPRAAAPRPDTALPFVQWRAHQ
jgi:hypothetical protein